MEGDGGWRATGEGVIIVTEDEGHNNTCVRIVGVSACLKPWQHVCTHIRCECVPETMATCVYAY